MYCRMYYWLNVTDNAEVKAVVGTINPQTALFAVISALSHPLQCRNHSLQDTIRHPSAPHHWQSEVDLCQRRRVS